MTTPDPHLRAAQIIQDAGGELVGRTRLQKVAYLAQLAGFQEDFAFEYRHYGPFSEDLARGIEIAAVLGPICEVERKTDWGGHYSIFSLVHPEPPVNAQRSDFLLAAKAINAVELELAATAAFLFDVEGIGREKPGNPWHETRLRKPEKAKEGRLEKAADAYTRLQQLPTPRRLPDLPRP